MLVAIGLSVVGLSKLGPNDSLEWGYVAALITAAVALVAFVFGRLALTCPQRAGELGGGGGRRDGWRRPPGLRAAAPVTALEEHQRAARRSRSPHEPLEREHARGAVARSQFRQRADGEADLLERGAPLEEALQPADRRALEAGASHCR